MFKLILTGKIIQFIAPKMMPFILFSSGTFFCWELYKFGEVVSIRIYLVNVVMIIRKKEKFEQRFLLFISITYYDGLFIFKSHT